LIKDWHFWQRLSLTAFLYSLRLPTAIKSFITVHCRSCIKLS